MQRKDVLTYLLDEAEKITTRAKTRNRRLTEDERKRVEENLERVQELKDNAQIAAAIEGMKSGRPADGAPVAKSSGSVMFDRSGFREFTKSVADGFPATMKATVTIGGGGIPSAYQAPGSAVTVAREAVRLRSLFPLERVDAPAVWFRRISTGAAQAAAVAEGDLKPEATIAVTPVEAPVRKNAVFLPDTDEAVADGGQQFAPSSWTTSPAT